MPRPDWQIPLTRTQIISSRQSRYRRTARCWWADGNILAGGFVHRLGGQPRNRIARLDTTTGLADSFKPNANDFVETIALQADGKVLVGGLFNVTNSIGGQSRSRIARLDATTG